MDSSIILLILLGLLLAGGYAWYASLITRRNEVREAMGSIDVQLRKRFDLLPNIVALATKFMTHEKELLEGLTALRAKVGVPYSKDDPKAVAEHLEASKGLEQGMARFFAVAENYPELRSAETITRAQETFEEVEGNIAAARRFYNSAVTRLNNAVEIFPGSFIARIANVQPFPFYEVEDPAAREPVDVNKLMA
ncbi:LemA family protein [Parvibaculum sp.]|jgi:LemA protein|uniref:LemA family protein n=1 Tax=Parvibaculum sp. TaxID=2024848 RepID=UPI000C3A9348|nr:LemA family protein [Parvibaculum sp.]MAM95996.1 LemA family protein [Parvibaculum sp.]HCX68404.1 LemA family protein [Rhodobiaceae bacterium]|tara:strand:+ start:41406 stop:41987 length:582 start_codon:yes stop_codon:yes gene_type:complete